MMYLRVLRQFCVLVFSLLLTVQAAVLAQPTAQDPDQAPNGTGPAAGPEGAYKLVFGGRNWIDVVRVFNVGMFTNSFYLPAFSNLKGTRGKLCLYGESESTSTVINSCEGGATPLERGAGGAFRMILHKGYPFETSVEVRLSPDGDGFKGQWRAGEDFGVVQMTRLTPLVSSVFIRARHGSGLSDWVGGPLGDQVPSLSLKGVSSVYPNKPGTNVGPTKLLVQVIGSNLWGGVDVLIPKDRGLTLGPVGALGPVSEKGVEPAQNFRRHRGLRFEINAAKGAPPGLIYIRVAGQKIPILLAWDGEIPRAETAPEVSRIVLLDEANQPIEQITEGLPFRVGVVYDGDTENQLETMQLSWVEPGRQPIKRSRRNKRQFRSDLYVLEHYDLPAMEGEPEYGKSLRSVFPQRYDPKQSKDALIRFFFGRWSVKHEGSVLGQQVKLLGAGRFTNAGASPLALIIGEGDAARSFTATDIFARETTNGDNRESEGTGKGLADVILREIPRIKGETAQDAARRATTAQRISEPIKGFQVPIDQTSMTVRVGGKRKEIPIVRTDPKGLADAYLKLIPAETGAGYVGLWREKRPTWPEEEARQIWKKPARIKDAQSVEPQKYGMVDDAGIGFGYPFDRAGQLTGDHTTRRVLVTGYFPFGEDTPFTSDDPTVSYSVIPITKAEETDLRRRARAANGYSAALGAQAFLLEADLKPGVQEGLKTIKTYGSEGAWKLNFGRVVKTSFVRPGTPAGAVETEFKPGETLRIQFQIPKDGRQLGGAGKQSFTPGPMDGLEVALYKRDKNGTLRTYGLLPISEDGIGLGRTGPIRLVGEGELSAFQPDPDTNALDVEVGPEDTLIAAPIGIRGLPSQSKATISIPDQPTSVFDEALKTVAACHATSFSDRAKFAHQASTTINKSFLFSFRQNVPQYSVKTRVLHGDHAALIVLRKYLEPMARADLAAMKQQLNDAAINRLFNSSKTNPLLQNSTFWDRKFTVILDENDRKTFTLRDLFAPEKLKRYAPEGVNAYRDFMIKQVRPAYKAMIDEAEAALQRVVNANDCDVAELLIVAGQRANRVVTAALPGLVKQTPHPGPPPRVSVEPDALGRRFVSGVHLVGSEVRAIEDYAQIDRAYQALALTGTFAAVALPFGSVAAILAGAEGTSLMGGAAAALVIAGDLMELGLIAPQDINEYLKREEDAATIRGLSLQVDRGALEEAEARRDSALAALGALMPAAGVAQGVKLTKDALSLQRGRRLLESLPESQRLSALTGESADLARAALADAWERAARGVGSESDKQLLARAGILIENDLLEIPRQGTKTLLTRPKTPEALLAMTDNGKLVVQNVAEGTPAEIRFGQHIASGVGAQVYADADEPAKYVLRVVGGPDAAGDFGGRAVVEGLPDTVKSIVEVAERPQLFKVEGYEDLWVERVARTPAAKTQASQTLDPWTGKRLPLEATGARMSSGQAMALAAATRVLNRQGFAWTDNHLGNFRFVPIDEAKDLWRIKIIDTGHIYQASGGTAYERYVNARAAQEVFNFGDRSQIPVVRNTVNALKQMVELSRRGEVNSDAYKAAQAYVRDNRQIAMGRAFRNLEYDETIGVGGQGIMSANRPAFRNAIGLQPSSFEAAYRIKYGEDLARNLPPIPN